MFIKLLSAIILLITNKFTNSYDITKTTKSANNRAYRVESLETLKNKIANNNCLIVFHADWCSHW
jgi:Na+-transporting NADH:ubiquinone oxidoreductase subunit NqrF